MKNGSAIGKCVEDKFTKSDFFIHNQNRNTKKKYALSKTGYVRKINGLYIGIDKRYLYEKDRWVITELLSGNMIGTVLKKSDVVQRVEILADPVKEIMESEKLKAHIAAFDKMKS